MVEGGRGMCQGRTGSGRSKRAELKEKSKRRKKGKRLQVGKGMSGMLLEDAGEGVAG